MEQQKLKQQGCDLIDYLNLRERIISVQSGERDEVDTLLNARQLIKKLLKIMKIAKVFSV